LSTPLKDAKSALAAMSYVSESGLLPRLGLFEMYERRAGDYYFRYPMFTDMVPSVVGLSRSTLAEGFMDASCVESKFNGLVWEDASEWVSAMVLAGTQSNVRFLEQNSVNSGSRYGSDLLDWTAGGYACDLSEALVGSHVLTSVWDGAQNGTAALVCPSEAAPSPTCGTGRRVSKALQRKVANNAVALLHAVFPSISSPEACVGQCSAQAGHQAIDMLIQRCQSTGFCTNNSVSQDADWLSCRTQHADMRIEIEETLTSVGAQAPLEARFTVTSTSANVCEFLNAHVSRP
jgi:hypothetical protein